MLSNHFIYKISDSLNDYLRKYRDAKQAKFGYHCYYYALTSHRWGHDAAEFISAIKHASLNNYGIIFIVDSTSRNIRRLLQLTVRTYCPIHILCVRKLFQLKFTDCPELNPSNWKLWLSYESQIIKTNYSAITSFPWIKNFYWPYSNPFKIALHTSELVHPYFSCFHMNRYTYDRQLIYEPLESCSLSEDLSFLDSSKSDNSFSVLHTLYDQLKESDYFKIAINIRSFSGSGDRNSSLNTYSKVLELLPLLSGSKKPQLIFYGNSPSNEYLNLAHSCAVEIIDLTRNNTFLSYSINSIKDMSVIYSEQICLSCVDLVITPDSGSCICPYICGKQVLILDGYYALPPFSRCLYLPRPILSEHNTLLSSHAALEKCISTYTCNPIPSSSNTYYQIQSAFETLNATYSKLSYLLPTPQIDSKDGKLNNLNLEHNAIFPFSVYSRPVAPSSFYLVDHLM